MTSDSDNDALLDDRVAGLHAAVRAADHADRRSITGVDRDVRTMPPGAVICYDSAQIARAAVDTSQVAAAGRQLIEAREAVATAKAMLGRAALHAHSAGCALSTMAKMSGVDRHTISRTAWAYFDTRESPQGEAWRDYYGPTTPRPERSRRRRR